MVSVHRPCLMYVNDLDEAQEGLNGITNWASPEGRAAAYTAVTAYGRCLCLGEVDPGLPVPFSRAVLEAATAAHWRRLSVASAKVRTTEEAHDLLDLLFDNEAVHSVLTYANLADALWIRELDRRSFALQSAAERRTEKLNRLCSRWIQNHAAAWSPYGGYLPWWLGGKIDGVDE